MSPAVEAKSPPPRSKKPIPAPPAETSASNAPAKPATPTKPASAPATAAPAKPAQAKPASTPASAAPAETTPPAPKPPLVPFVRPKNKTHPVTGQAWLEPHRYADMLPRMTDAEYEALLASVQADGLQEPIVIFEDSILDGRHRFRACWEAGKPYRLRLFDGADPLTYVLSSNLYRRHLNTSQQAIIAAEAAKERATVRGKGRKREGEVGITEAIGMVVAATGTPERSIRRAMSVLDADIGPLTDAVRDGNLRVSTACDALALVDRGKIAEAVREGTLEAAIRAAKHSNGATPPPTADAVAELGKKLGVTTLTKTCDCDLLILMPPYAGLWERKLDDCIAHLHGCMSLWAETGPDHIAVGWRNAPDLFDVAAALSKIPHYSLVHLAGWVASMPDAPIHLSGMVRSLMPVLLYQRTGFREPRKRFELDHATMYGLDAFVRPVPAAPPSKGFSRDLSLHAAIPDECFRWLGTALTDANDMVACPMTPNEALTLLRQEKRKAVGISPSKAEVVEGMAASGP